LLPSAGGGRLGASVSSSHDHCLKISHYFNSITQSSPPYTPSFFIKLFRKIYKVKKVSHKVQSISESLQKKGVGEVRKRAKRVALGYVRWSQDVV